MSIFLAAVLTAAMASANAEDSKQSANAKSAEAPIPKKIPAKATPKDDVSVRIRTNDNGDVVEEYRQGGRVNMVKVTPARGKPYYIMDNNGDGRLDRDDAEAAGGIVPVSWIIAEW
jgi:uncharacterized protein (DUF4415 family)